MNLTSTQSLTYKVERTGTFSTLPHNSSSSSSSSVTNIKNSLDHEMTPNLGNKIPYCTRTTYIGTIIILIVTVIVTSFSMYYVLQVKTNMERVNAKEVGAYFITNVNANYDRNILPIQTMAQTLASFYASTPDTINVYFDFVMSSLFSQSFVTNIFLLQHGTVTAAIGEPVVQIGENNLLSAAVYNYSNLPDLLTSGIFLINGIKKLNQTEDGVISLCPMIKQNHTVWGHMGAWLSLSNLIPNSSMVGYQVADYYIEINEITDNGSSNGIYRSHSSPHDANNMVKIPFQIAQANWVLNIQPSHGWPIHIDVILPCIFVASTICTISILILVFVHRSIRLKQQSIVQVHQIKSLGNQIEQDQNKISILSSREQTLLDQLREMRLHLQHIHLRWDRGYCNINRKNSRSFEIATQEEDEVSHILPSHVSMKQDYICEQWTLDKIMAHPVCIEYFKDHARDNYALESVLFLAAVNHYNELGHEESLRDQMHILAKRIYADFIEENSCCQINIPSVAKQTLCKRMKLRTYPSDLFDECRREIVNLIQVNLIPSFLASDRFCMFLRSISAMKKQSTTLSLDKTESHM